MATARQAGGGGEKHVDDLSALMIGLIGNAEQQQHPHHQDDANEQGITDHQAALFLDAHPTQKARILKAMPKKGEASSSDTGLPPLQQAQGEPDAQGGGAEGDHPLRARQTNTSATAERPSTSK